MNDNQFILASVLFSNKYQGVSLRTIENVPKNLFVDIIQSHGVAVTGKRYKLFKVNGEILFWNIHDCITFYIDIDTPKSDKICFNFEEFVETFKIPLEDIV